MIYFDNAATTFPKPPAVVQAVREALVRYGANPGRSGHDLSMQTALDPTSVPIPMPSPTLNFAAYVSFTVM